MFIIKLSKYFSLLTLGIVLSACATTTSRTVNFTQAQEAYQQGNYRQALLDLNTLAVQGDREAQYALGYMYYYGQGTKPNVDLARGWFQQAQAKGLTKAKKALDTIDRPIFPMKEGLLEPVIPAQHVILDEEPTYEDEVIEPEPEIVADKRIGDWAVQAASFAEPGNATRAVDNLAAKGYDAYKLTEQNSKGVMITRILLGPIQDREAAEDLVSTLKAQEDIDSIIVRYSTARR